MNLRASVIIPNLDCPLVGDTVRAVASQTLDDGALEILVVGRDEPGLVPRQERVRFLETTEPVSAGAARNLGVAAAATDRILFTDADCRPAPDWARLLLRALGRSPVAGGSVRFDLAGNLWAVADNIASFNELLDDRPAADNTNGPLGSLNLAVTTEAWQRVGPFDESLVTGEDFDWVLRARAAELALGFEPRAVVHHAAIRRDRQDVVTHAEWYGRHFNDFRRRHPGVFDSGPSWRSRRRLALVRPIKALVSATQIFLRHPDLLTGWRAFPGVVTFKLAWYKSILETWQEQ
jgi:GT2 family glycosyltransferase